MASNDNLKMLRVSDETHDRIAAEGKYGDSMNDILERLLNELDELRKLKSKK
jgi:hypothetical protein